jgi:hypothetical protein
MLEGAMKKNTPFIHTPTPTLMLDSPMLDLSGLFLFLEVDLLARINPAIRLAGN